MNMLNSVIVEGKPTEKVHFENGIARFTLVTERVTKDLNGNTVTVNHRFNFEASGRMAEIISVNFDKYKRIRVVGRLEQRMFTDKDKKSVSETVVVCEHLEHLEKTPTEQEEEDIPRF